MLNQDDKTKRDDSYEHTINLNGVHGFVFSTSDEGINIVVGGWNNDHWCYKQGHRVLLIKKDKSETRYKIEKVTHCGDPRDQYFIDCSFCPRA